VVIMRANGLKVRGLKHGRGIVDFLRAIRIRSTTFFRRKIKPSASCRKILRLVESICGV
jgi:hypothetical protein